ncbi:MAG TPA: ABC transporter ATP-binding protein [Firmicutes bacterium]|nr:ABC transporter ATP-binding protein [Bacillota bacterium]
MTILKVKDLAVSFQADKKTWLQVIDNINFEVRKGEVLGIVGESGCGKSVTALSIMRLISNARGRYDAGSIEFMGQDILKISDAKMRNIRGNKISMIFQDPMTSLNPVFTIGNQLTEVIKLHQKVDNHEAWKIGCQMLQLVGITDLEENMRSFPHQLSGGMRQRVMIAIALACQPELIIADEPTTALDVTIQAQVLELMLELQSTLGTSIMLITHDLGVIAEMAHRVIVMYTGRIVESANVKELFSNARHPYTQGLMASIPRLDYDSKYLKTIEGTVPPVGKFPKGCRFNPRCPYCMDICKEANPPEIEVNGSEDHIVYCWKEAGGELNGRGAYSS